MTVSYTAEVATCKNFGCFLKLLWRWRGSIYKLVWKDLLAFLCIYYILNLLYRFVLEGNTKLVFESLVHYCNSYVSLIPLSFVLGFYVSVVMTRWWDQYISIPWPDSIAVFVSAHIYGQDERGRVMRRTIMRYVCLCLTIVLTLTAPRVKKRFPTLDHLIEAGLLLENEKDVIEVIEKAFPKHPKHWMPIVWAASIVTRARKEGRIRDDLAVKTIIDELNKFRGMCGTLMYYDWISIPLVYTQVVTLAVYSYFLCSVIGRQWTEGKNDSGYPNYIDLYFPVFTTLQFFFYMGWLKVAESLINPFGEDDDDFEVNWMIDRNLQVSYLIVDEMHHEHPELVRDQYWDEVFPNELPYANEGEGKREEPPEASTAHLDLDYTRKLNTGILSSITVESTNTQLNGKIHKSSDNINNDSRISTLSSNLKNVTIHSTSRSVNNIAEGKLLTSLSLQSQETENAIKAQSKPSVSSPLEGSLESFYASDDEMDAFDRLKAEREHERIERQRLKFVRSLGNATALNLETEPVSTSTPVNQSRQASHATIQQNIPEILSHVPSILEEPLEAASTPDVPSDTDIDPSKKKPDEADKK